MNAAVSKTEKPAQDNRRKLLERTMARFNYSGDALIEVLHAAQELYGCLEPPLLAEIAAKLRLPPSRVLGVASFYHFFSLEPQGEHTMLVCTGTACYVAGAQKLLSKLECRCAKAGTTSADGKMSVHGARCVGSCGLAPVVVLDGKILPKVTPEKLDELLDELEIP